MPIPFIKELISKFTLDPVEKLNIDIAQTNPNPFHKSNSDTKIARSRTLYLADGGEDGQNVPLLPLIHRKVSAIFAFDQSADKTIGQMDQL